MKDESTGYYRYLGYFLYFSWLFSRILQREMESKKYWKRILKGNEVGELEIKEYKEKEDRHVGFDFEFSFLPDHMIDSEKEYNTRVLKPSEIVQMFSKIEEPKFDDEWFEEKIHFLYDFGDWYTVEDEEVAQDIYDSTDFEKIKETELKKTPRDFFFYTELKKNNFDDNLIQEISDYCLMGKSKYGEILLSCISFKLDSERRYEYRKKDIKESLKAFKSDRLESRHPKNLYTYKIQKENTLKILTAKYNFFGKRFILSFSEIPSLEYYNIYEILFCLESDQVIKINFFKRTDGDSIDVYLEFDPQKIGREELNILGISKEENNIKKIYLYKQSLLKYKLIVVGSISSKLINPKSSTNPNSWVEGLYEISEKGKCIFSDSIQGINNNTSLQLYGKGTFSKTKIVKIVGNTVRKEREIEIVKVKDEEEFRELQRKYKV
ncbi:hypothetical protein IPN41_00675 [Candidatus Falkowbacteria bacterium]|nr:MAG: hypothetical protein IPN41_00675 [Candidatus Falkowbacteria bacterium]